MMLIQKQIHVRPFATVTAAESVLLPLKLSLL